MRSGHDVNELVVRWQEQRDARALDALTRRYLPLVRSLARRYGHSSIPNEDLNQVGSLGLVKAINRFDVDRGLRFESFAIPTILGELRRHFRDSGWAVHVTRGAQERALVVRDAQELLSVQTGRSPSPGQLAEYLEISVEDVLDALQALSAYQASSLDTPHDEDEGTPLIECFGSEDTNFELVERITTARGALRRLDDRQSAVLYMRFFEGLSQSEIAARLGVSQMQVSRILSKVLRELQRTVAESTALDGATRGAPSR